jgi:hypothetical protein
MSRAFTPPDTLSKDDIKTIADVRRSIWTDGLKGLVLGSLSGYIAHRTAKIFQAWSMNRAVKAAAKTAGHCPDPSDLRYFLKGITFSKNTACMSFMAGGAIGGFVLASAAGKSTVHNLHPIFEIGKEDRSTRYQQLVKKAQVLEEEKEREDRRIRRRKTLHENLVHGQGLSDSHGGKWEGK